MKKRKGYQWIEDRKDNQGKLLCLIPTCDNLRQKHKTRPTYRKYCSEHVYSDIWDFTSWKTIRENAFKRDNYSCVKCGDNRKEIKVSTKQKRMSNKVEFLSGREKPKYEFYDYSYLFTNFIGDHIIPISLGGDEFDIDNVQTLCIKCNKIKTAEDQKKIAVQRRKEKIDNYKNMEIIE